MKKITAVILAACTIAFAGCNAITGASNIEYRVSGSAARASLTYESAGGGTSQESNRTLPWSHSFRAERDAFLYVSAQNSGQTGCVTAEIYKNGDRLESATSCGAFVIATASGTNR